MKPRNFSKFNGHTLFPSDLLVTRLVLKMEFGMKQWIALWSFVAISITILIYTANTPPPKIQPATASTSSDASEIKTSPLSLSAKNSYYSKTAAQEQLELQQQQAKNIEEMKKEIHELKDLIVAQNKLRPPTQSSQPVVQTPPRPTAQSQVPAKSATVPVTASHTNPTPAIYGEGEHAHHVHPIHHNKTVVGNIANHHQLSPAATAAAAAAAMGKPGSTVPPPTATNPVPVQKTPPATRRLNDKSLPVYEQNGKEKKEHLEDICGVKAAAALIEYAKFQDTVINGSGPKRELIAVPVEAGLADRMFGVISLFWLAFVSKHAFFIGQFHKLPPFEAAFDHVFINWTRPQPDPDKYTAPLMFTYRGVRGYKGIRQYTARDGIDLQKYHMTYMINQDSMVDQIFAKNNMAQYPRPDRVFPHESHVFASSNRGGIHYFYNNPHHQKYFEEDLKLDRDNAFRCAYHYLFQENEKVRKVMEKHGEILAPASMFSAYTHQSHYVGESEYVNMDKPIEPIPAGSDTGAGSRKLLRGDVTEGRRLDEAEATSTAVVTTPTVQEEKKNEKAIVKIGIGIRVGDQSFDPVLDAKTQLGPFEHFLFCAQNIEKSLPNILQTNVAKAIQSLAVGSGKITATWYVMAESLRIRQLIANKYGNKVVTDAQTTYFHGDCASKTYGGCHQQKLDDAIIYAAAQMTLFSMCDIHIISGSGFPRMAAMIAKPPHRIYLIEDHSTTYNKTCIYGKHNPFSQIGKAGCGVRV